MHKAQEEDQFCDQYRRKLFKMLQLKQKHAKKAAQVTDVMCMLYTPSSPDSIQRPPHKEAIFFSQSATFVSVLSFILSSRHAAIQGKQF